jgi:tetratricopeptide (TPR) repeat protein
VWSPEKKRFFGILAFCWCLTAAAASLYGGGNRDPDLSRADELIKEKKYDEAIQVLTAYIKSNPDDFDKAQKRLRRIMEVQEEFNATADELLNTMVNDPDNTEKILRLITLLESFKSSRNAQVQNFIARTQSLARFSYNRTRLLRIFEEGRALVAAGDSQRALSVYAGGMDIYRDDFFAAGYGEIVENRVRGGIAALNRGIESFPATTAPLRAAAAEIVQAARQTSLDTAGGVSRMGDLVDRFISAAGPLEDFRQVLSETAAYFDEQLSQFQQADKTIGDRSFLSFASRLIRGGGDSSAEGMVGAVDAYWNRAASDVENALEGLADQAYTAALGDLKNRDYGRARGKFENAAAYSQHPLAVLEKRREFAGTAPERVLFDRPVLTAKVENFLTCRSLNRAAVYMVEAVSLETAFARSLETTPVFESWQRGGLNAGEAMAREVLIRQSSGRLLAETNALLTEASAETADLKNYQAGTGTAEDQGTDVPSYMKYMDTTVFLLSDLRDRIFDRDYESAVRYYTMAQGELEKSIAGQRAGYGEGNRLIQGIARSDDSGGIDHYPAEGLVLLARMEQEIGADTQWGNSILSQYTAEGPELRAAGDMPALGGSIQSLLNELGGLREQGRRLAATARSQIAQAESFRLDGERLYRESRTALSQGNFDIARNRIERAMEQFHASLTIQESASLRTEWDTQLVNLGIEINRLENEIVIRDVRNLVNEARTSYFAGNFEQAEGLLVRAQNRWRVTNVGTDGEIQYWLNVIRGALSLRAGKVIPPTAPLYAEMSQLLSDAKKKYEEGVRYLNANRRSEGLVKFAEARLKTQEVKLMFPVNQEAGMLELRIDQITDPPVFEATFGSRMSAAVAGIKNGSMEAFTELQNLAEINPRYPGIAAALVQAEIDIGLRPPAPDPRALARSSELTAAARQILNGNIVSQFEVALRQCDEAIALNPNNTQAMTIKDQIQTKMSGTGGRVVLDSRSEAEYQRAVRELQQGNNLVALAIVEQLLQDANNRSSTRILELQRRIQARL